MFNILISVRLLYGKVLYIGYRAKNSGCIVCVNTHTIYVDTFKHVVNYLTKNLMGKLLQLDEEVQGTAGLDKCTLSVRLLYGKVISIA